MSIQDGKGRPALAGPNADTFRHVLGHYPTGVAVITAQTPDGPAGMAMNSFTSLSLHPPLVLFCPASSSTTWPLLREVGTLADQRAVGRAGGGQPGLRRADR